MDKRIQLFFTALLMVLSILMFQNCAPSVHEEGLAVLGDDCETPLQLEFEKSFYPFLQNNCASCHSASGTQSANPFADKNNSVAFSAFKQIGAQRLVQKLEANHQGKQSLSTEANSIAQDYNKMEAAVLLCKDNNSGGPVGGYKLSEQRIGITEDNAITVLIWDLDNDFVGQKPNIGAGAKLEITIEKVTKAGSPSYYEVKNPVLRAGGNAIKVQKLNFLFNTQGIESVNIFDTILRYVPKSAGRKLSDGIGIIMPLTAINANDTINPIFANLESVDFEPTTYDALVAAGGLFARNNCISCHTTQLPLLNNYENIFGNSSVIRYKPEESKLYRAIQVNMPQNLPMMSEAEIKIVRDWILDGAPKSNNLNPPPSNEPVTFTQVNAMIRLTNGRCLNCHNANRADGSYRVDTYAEVMRAVIPNNPESSDLYQVVYRQSMPRGGQAVFTATELDKLKRWILAGAPNN